MCVCVCVVSAILQRGVCVGRGGEVVSAILQRGVCVCERESGGECDTPKRCVCVVSATLQ